MTDPRLQPLLDVIAANIAAAVLAELREGIADGDDHPAKENPAQTGVPGGVNSKEMQDESTASLCRRV